jgi:hypothetical protein
MSMTINPGFSDKNVQIELPVNFVDCLRNLSADAISVLIGFFQWISQQEQACEVALAFDFTTSLPWLLQIGEPRLQKAMDELHKAGLLFSWSDPHNPQKTYLIPGTPSGSGILQNLTLIQPGGEYHLAQILPAAERPTCSHFTKTIWRADPDDGGTIKAGHGNLYLGLDRDARKMPSSTCPLWKYVLRRFCATGRKGRKRSNEEGKRDLDQFRKLYLG